MNSTSKTFKASLGGWIILLLLFTLVGTAAAQTCVPQALFVQSPLHWWPGDGNANDFQGSNNGTLVNGATFAAGKVGQAFSFDGVDDYVDASLSQSLNVYTITAWAKPSAITVGAAVVGDRKAFPYVQIGGGAVWQFMNAYNAGSKAQVGQFDFLAATQTATTQQLYVNGALVKSIPGTSTLTSVNIGRRSDGVYFNGLIDDVKIYNRALDAREIKAVMFDAGTLATAEVDFNLKSSSINLSEMVKNLRAIEFEPGKAPNSILLRWYNRETGTREHHRLGCDPS